MCSLSYVSLQDLQTDAAEACHLGKRKRSIDTPIIRQKRQDELNFPNVTINQSIVNYIVDAVQPALLNVSLDSGKCLWIFWWFVHACIRVSHGKT